jgi:hypothetical protein
MGKDLESLLEWGSQIQACKGQAFHKAKTSFISSSSSLFFICP